MNRENIKYMAEDQLKEHGIFDKLDEYGKPLFLVISGSDNFGFPSEDSDIDVRGAYIAPTERFLGLRKKTEEPTFKYMSGDLELDVSIDEIGHFIRILANSNGNRLEWVHNPLIVYESPEFKNLKDIVDESIVSKKLSDHYLHFARDMWDGKTKEEGVKKDLYALRAYMIGTSILEDGKIVSDINKLNEKFGYGIVDEMVESKRENERSLAIGYDREELSKIIEELDERLKHAKSKSLLKDNPDIDKIDSYLVSLRKRSD